jgi:hypothetical protein
MPIEHMETRTELVAELDERELEISRQRLIRERATYRLEQLLRERDRLTRHLASLDRAEGAPTRC